MATPELPRDEVRAAIDARQELGPDMEPAVVDAFVNRIERAIEARVDARLAQHPVRHRDPSGGFGDALFPAMSLGVAIPLTAIAAGTSGVLGVLIVWLGIVAVNIAFARRAR